MRNLDAFDQLFGRGRPLAPLLTPEGIPYGRSETAQRALAVYYRAVDDLWATLASPPLPSQLAADILIGTTYGLISFPRHTRTVRWSSSQQMVDAAVKALLASWTGRQVQGPSTSK